MCLLTSGSLKRLKFGRADSMDGNEIRQGFLCPLCMEDLGGLEQLHQHVDTVHSTEVNTDAVNLIKGLSYFYLSVHV